MQREPQASEVSHKGAESPRRPAAEPKSRPDPLPVRSAVGISRTAAELRRSVRRCGILRRFTPLIDSVDQVSCHAEGVSSEEASRNRAESPRRPVAAPKSRPDLRRFPCTRLSGFRKQLPNFDAHCIVAGFFVASLL